MSNDDREIFELLNNIDDDLIDEQVDNLMEGVEFDMKKIQIMANNKVDEMEKIRNRRKRRSGIITAACICFVATGVVYAEPISSSIRNFVNKTTVYDTVVDGEAYYLKEPIQLDEGLFLESCFVSKNTFQVDYSTSDDNDQISVKIGYGGNIYDGGGYSMSPSTRENTKLYNVYFHDLDTVKDFDLIINEKTYPVSLDLADKIDQADLKIATINDKIDKPLEGVSIATKFSNIDGKTHVNIIPNFERDKRLELSAIDPYVTGYYKHITEYLDDGHVISSGSSQKDPEVDSEASENYIIDENGQKYVLTYDPYAVKVWPNTVFESTLDAGAKGTLYIDVISASIKDYFDTVDLTIPENGSTQLDIEYDLDNQKLNIDSIERISPTQAVINLTLNTGDEDKIKIDHFSIKSSEYFNNEIEIIEDKATITFDIDENTSDISFGIAYPTFSFFGNWEIEVNN